MGIRIGRRFLKLWKLVRPRTRPSSYVRLGDDDDEQFLQEKKQKRKKIKRWVADHRKESLLFLLFPAARGGKDDGERGDEEEMFGGVAPKGHLVVYVGEEEDQQRRFVVPVIYFNHPLFGQLLKESVEEYGFSQPGGITIPCHVSYFKTVQERIAAERFSGKWKIRGRRNRQVTGRHGSNQW